MRRSITSMALLAALGGSDAIAQTGGTGGSSPATKNPPAAFREAPIGHRQPRADQLPPEKYQSDPNDPLTRENQALDRKIKSICRGC